MHNIFFLSFYNLAHQSKFFDNIVIFTANILPYFVVLLLIIFLSYKKSSYREFVVIFGSSVLAYLFSHILKILIHIPRPFLSLPNVQPLFMEDSFSFPSGHASFFSALAVAVFLYDRRAGYLFIVFALLIGLARIISGVHTPLDILGGFVLGSMVAYLARLFYRKFAFFPKSV